MENISEKGEKWKVTECPEEVPEIRWINKNISKWKKNSMYFKCFFDIYFSSITQFHQALRMVLSHLTNVHPLLKDLTLKNENKAKILTCKEKKIIQILQV